MDKTKPIEQMARCHCQCLYTRHDNEATGILNWLKDEVDTAPTLIFYESIFPFLAKLYGGMQWYNLSVSETQQEACQHMVSTFLNRRVGMEPPKPATWARPTLGCGKEACLICPELYEFLKDPEKGIGYLEDGRSQWGRGYLHGRAYEHECTPDYEMKDGRKMLRVKTLDAESAWAYEGWERRCSRVASELKWGLLSSRQLLGKMYEELVEMRPIEICA